MKNMILPNYTYLSSENNIVPVVSRHDGRKQYMWLYKIVSETEQGVWDLLADVATKAEGHFFQVYGKATIGKGFVVFRGDKLNQAVQPYKLPMTGKLRFSGVFGAVFVEDSVNMVTYETRDLSKEYISTITDVEEKELT